MDAGPYRQTRRKADQGSGPVVGDHDNDRGWSAPRHQLPESVLVADLHRPAFLPWHAPGFARGGRTWHQFREWAGGQIPPEGGVASRTRRLLCGGRLGLQSHAEMGERSTIHPPSGLHPSKRDLRRRLLIPATLQGMKVMLWIGMNLGTGTTTTGCYEILG